MTQTGGRTLMGTAELIRAIARMDPDHEPGDPGDWRDTLRALIARARALSLWVRGRSEDVVIYTRDQVSQAMNDSASLITDDGGLFPFETSQSIRDHSLIDLVVNAAMTLLDEPGMSLDDIMRANWQAEDEGEDAAEMVRGWLA